MKRGAYHRKFNLSPWLIFLLLGGCVEPIAFDVPPSKSIIMVEGMITDKEPPYTVYVSTAIALDSDSVSRPPVTGATITLFDDEGNQEVFAETSPGVYSTAGAIQGQLNHSYHIRIETEGGNVFESRPDKINPVGSIQEIRYEYEARTVEYSYGIFPADVFKIFVDSDGGPAKDVYVRWRFTGTYKVLTFPELRRIFLQGVELMDPLPCSGYVVAPALGGGKLEQVEECSCCTCWAKHYEFQPQLSDEQLVENNQFKNIIVGEVPINQATFYEKYHVEVEQMSLSRTAYEFFKLIRSQKEGATSIFQPSPGAIVGNVFSVNSTTQVVGLFWASAISSDAIYIFRDDVPYILPPIYFATEDCRKYYANASTTKPSSWE